MFILIVTLMPLFVSLNIVLSMDKYQYQFCSSNQSVTIVRLLDSILIPDLTPALVSTHVIWCHIDGIVWEGGGPL